MGLAVRQTALLEPQYWRGVRTAGEKKNQSYIKIIKSLIYYFILHIHESYHRGGAIVSCHIIPPEPCMDRIL